MEARQARSALDDVRQRTQQVHRTTERESWPWWIPAHLLLVLTVTALVHDVAGLLTVTEPWRTALPWVALAAGLLTLPICYVVVLRTRRIRPRHEPRRVAVRLVLAVAGYLATFLGVGPVLRDADLAWASTVAGLAGLLAATIVYAVVEAVSRRSGR